MKNFWKVALATLAVVGIAKLAKGHCEKDGKCKNFKQKRASKCNLLLNYYFVLTLIFLDQEEN